MIHRIAVASVILAAIGATAGWNVGSTSKYRLVSTILSSEISRSDASGEIGFRMTNDVDVTALWRDPKNRDSLLLKIEVKSPQLWIKSRRAPEPEGFVEHSSPLDRLSAKPVFALWQIGQITRLYLHRDEKLSWRNLKRGVASIFHYRTLDGNYRELDASGWCNVTYESRGATSLEKTKNYCADSNADNGIFGVVDSSRRRAVYQLDSDSLPIVMDDYERHDSTITVKNDAGTSVTSRRILERLSTDSAVVTAVTAETAELAIAQLENGYEAATIELETEPKTCPESGCQMLDEIITENRNALENSALGTMKSSLAFLKVVPAVRGASIEQLTSLLKSPKNYPIRKQLFDALGAACTPAVHQAAMKMLRKDETGDDTERYLWALSLSPSPHSDIIKDILKRSEETHRNDGVSETLALTAASMARRNGAPSVIEKVRASLEIGLDSCSGDDCRSKFLRALSNLAAKASLPTLLGHAINGTRANSLTAWQALSAISSVHLTDRVRREAAKTFYQLGARRDSSVRACAVDIILNNRPSVSDLRGIIDYLGKGDPAFEIRRYVAQRVRQLAEGSSDFRGRLLKAESLRGGFPGNYDVLAYRGLSTAFERSFLTSSAANGSLVTIQEVNSGLLKRGIVDVVMRTPHEKRALFSLGLFTSGLGSFVGSSEDQPDEDTEFQEETATAGMEISLMGVGIRPFVFFSGRGELMGHVWSGTASERTTAYQSIAHLHRHSQRIPMASGVVAESEVDGAVSLDLAGQIQLSLWSRNAQSLVELAAGIAVRGESRVRTEFIQNTAEFVVTGEPKLELSTDVDFSGPVSVCMRLGQPAIALRHNVYKIERIRGSRHKLRKSKRTVMTSPGKSYYLNRKNNEMCARIFS